MNECMNEGRLNYKLIPMCVSAYVSLLHDSASDGARTALAPCLETRLAPWLAPCYGSRQPTLYLLAMIWVLLLVHSLHSPLLKRRDNLSEVYRKSSKIMMVMLLIIQAKSANNNAANDNDNDNASLCIHSIYCYTLMLYLLSPLYSLSSCCHSHSQTVCGIDIASSTSTVSCVNFSPSTLCLFNVLASD